MKSSSKILILAIFLVFICCVSAASAAENDNSTTDSVSLSDEVIGEVDEISEETQLASGDGVNVDEKLMDGESNEVSSDEGYVVYVGHHNTTEGGNGTYDNPFSTLKLACDNATGKDNVTLRIFSGNYTLGAVLNFDASILKIEGIDGTVIIKNVYDRKANKNEYIGESFGSTSNNVNFTISNIILMHLIV